jgi:hypothetical protein
MLPLALHGVGRRHGTFPAATRADRGRVAAMTDTASERIRVEAPADRCFDVAVDYESYPSGCAT